MTNKLEEYLRIAEIHRNDPELKRVDGEYIVKKLKVIQKQIFEMTGIFGTEESDIEKLNKIEGVLKIYEETLYNFKYDWYEAPNYPIDSRCWPSFEDAEKYMVELKDEGWDGFSPIGEYEEEIASISFNPDKITRIVVVGEGGRKFEKWFDECEVSLQDDGRTVKFFTK